MKISISPACEPLWIHILMDNTNWVHMQSKSVSFRWGRGIKTFHFLYALYSGFTPVLPFLCASYQFVVFQLLQNFTQGQFPFSATSKISFYFFFFPLTLSLAPGPTATTVPSSTVPWPFSGRRTPPLVFWEKNVTGITSQCSYIYILLLDNTVANMLRTQTTPSTGPVLKLLAGKTTSFHARSKRPLIFMFGKRQWTVIRYMIQPPPQFTKQFCSLIKTRLLLLTASIHTEGVWMNSKSSA